MYCPLRYPRPPAQARPNRSVSPEAPARRRRGAPVCAPHPAVAIDLSDLDPQRIADWTDEQKERASRAGLPEEVFTAASSEDEDERQRFYVSIVPPNAGSNIRFIVRKFVR